MSFLHLLILHSFKPCRDMCHGEDILVRKINVGLRLHFEFTKNFGLILCWVHYCNCCTIFKSVIVLEWQLLGFCQNFQHPCLGIIFRNVRRVQRFMLCLNYMMLPFILNPPSFKAMFCYICGRRRVAVVRYRMICLVLDLYNMDTNSHRQFQVNISKDSREIFTNSNNSSEKYVKHNNGGTWLVLPHDKFIYQISSQYLKWRQRKVQKTRCSTIKVTKRQ